MTTPVPTLPPPVSPPAAGRAGWVAAVDLGATSGRVMLGHVGPGRLHP